MEEKLRTGVDYYPEHWDKSLWKSDVELMKEAGVNIVRMAEFAWSRFEQRWITSSYWNQGA